MATRVYLHVGLPKTGTTFIQTVLWENRPALAEQGIAELHKYVDSLITIPNQKLLTVLGGDMTLLDAFRSANQVLQGETLMMLKEHFIEAYGVPKWTVGTGGSGIQCVPPLGRSAARARAARTRGRSTRRGQGARHRIRGQSRLRQ